MSDTQKKASLNQVAMKAGIFYILSQLFVRGISFLTTPVFTRLLTKAQYSDFSRYESWLLIFGPVMSLCLWRSVERAKYDVKEHFNEFVSSVQILSYASITVFFVIFWCLRDKIGPLFHMTDLMLLIAFLYTYAHTSIYYMQRREKQMMRYKASTLLTAATVIPATLLSILFVVIGKKQGFEDLVTLRILGYHIPLIIGGFTVAILMTVQGRRLVHFSYWNYALAFSLPLIPEVLSIQIMNQADKLMVISLTGKTNGSVFSLATTVSYIIWILEDSVWNAWLPWMYEKISAGEEDGICSAWTLLMHAFGMISLLLVAFSPEIILILGGHSYQDAVYLIAPMVTGTLFRFYSYSYTAIQNYYKKTGFVAATTVLTMLLNVVLNYTFIRLLGYRAAAYTTAFSYLVLMMMQAFMEWKLTGRQLIGLRKTLLVSCSWFLVCMAAMLTFSLPLWIRYLLILLVSVPACYYFLPKLVRMKKILKPGSGSKK